MSKKNRDSISTKVLGYFFTAGQFWRKTVKPSITEVQGHIDSANAAFRSFAPDGTELKQDLKTGFAVAADILRHGASGAIAKGHAIALTGKEALAGLPKSVTPVLLKLNELEGIAAGKAERAVTELTALADARRYFDSTLKAEALIVPSVNLDASLEHMQNLLTAAEAAIKTIPTTAGELQKLHVQFIGAMGEIGELAAEYEEVFQLRLSKFNEFDSRPTANPELSQLRADMDAMGSKIRSQVSSPSLAIELSNLGCRINALTNHYTGVIAHINAEIGRLQSIESQLDAAQRSAARQGIDKIEELFALGNEAFRALRSAPRDLKTAEEKTAAYIALAFDLAEKEQANSD